jgi:hypothetical protein
MNNKKSEIYIYINGLSIPRDISLGDGITLKPAKNNIKTDTIFNITKTEIVLGVAILFLKQIHCQLHITASNQKELAIKAWNSMWDIILISALTTTEIGFNLQGDVSFEDLNSKSTIKCTNPNFLGFSKSGTYDLNDFETNKIETHFKSAKKLMDKAEFFTAIHSLHSYVWNPHPRAQLAVLWSGIEALFNISNELTFRLSIYASQFLFPDDKAERLKIFNKVKELYKMRSTAVHGSKIKGNTKKAIDESVLLLKDLLWKCIENNEIPDPNKLIP